MVEHQQDQHCSPPPGSLIQLLRPVGGPDDQHPLLAHSAGAVKLHQELRLDPPARLVVRVGSPKC